MSLPGSNPARFVELEFPPANGPILDRFRSYHQVAVGMTITAAEVIALFNATFADERTVLVAGPGEPFYRAWQDDRPAEVIFAHGFVASAFHEIAHWCIAGRQRRSQDDFGYWYLPDGRDADQQAAFEQVEDRPQALEWAFHVAAGTQFHISMDNLGGPALDPEPFTLAVLRAADGYRRHGYPPRAQRWIDALAGALCRSGPPGGGHWQRCEIG